MPMPPRHPDPLPLLRTRLAVGLISLAVLALELALMRTMALRFQHHFAQMVVSVALLGFGASGTMLALLRRKVLAAPRGWLCGLALGFAASIPLSLLAAERVSLDVRLLAWDAREVLGVLLVELVLFVPFFLAAGAIGVVLMDRPERLGGHYAVNLLGSGIGGLAAVALMNVLTTGQLLSATAAAAAVAAGVILPWRRAGAVVLAGAIGGGLAWFGLYLRYEPPIGPDKTLSVVRQMPGTRLIHHDEGPLGRIDVVTNDAFHYAPWLSLSWTEPPPPEALMIFDGESVSCVYHCRRREDWRFMDYTTAAAGYHARRPRSVLIVGAGGGSDIALAAYHRAGRTVALEMNGRVIRAMDGPLRDRGGSIYRAPGVTVIEQEARGYLASAGGPAGTGRAFDLIQVPPADAFAAAGAGVHAARESYLYTVESFAAMLDRLSPTGVLSVTRRAFSPPREALRILDTAAEALRGKGRDPRAHLAMIRSWATVTVLAFASPIQPDDARRIERFCEARSFDLCALPGLAASRANRFHKLERADFFEGAAALLGPHRKQYLDDYLFEVAAATDDRPYFHHFFRWRALRVIADQPGAGVRNFLELGYLLLLAALGQAVLLAAAFILLPLVPGLRRARGPSPGATAATFAYFLLLGAGFLLLEMGFLQRLVLYLAHPIYSAAVAIAGFLIFAGLGSECSRRWRGRGGRITATAGGAAAGISLGLLLVLDAWLGWTQMQPLWLRMVVAAGTIAPLAFAMGHMFPTALRGVSAAAPALVPWAWAVNGFASVLAAVAAPLLAMEIGFSGVVGLAIACYAAAAVVGRKLPGAETTPSPAKPIRV